jgi:hypothetical protein
MDSKRIKGAVLVCGDPKTQPASGKGQNARCGNKNCKACYPKQDDGQTLLD